MKKIALMVFLIWTMPLAIFAQPYYMENEEFNLNDNPFNTLLSVNTDERIPLVEGFTFTEQKWFFEEENFKWLKFVMRHVKNLKVTGEFDISSLVPMGYATVIQKNDLATIYSLRKTTYYFYKGSLNKKMIIKDKYSKQETSFFYKPIENKMTVFNGKVRLIIDGLDAFLILPTGTIFEFDPSKHLTIGSFKRKGNILEENKAQINEKANQIVRRAKELLGTNRALTVNGKTFNNDCSGFVSALFLELDYDLVKGIENVKRRSGYNLTAIIYDAQDWSQNLFYSQDVLPGDLVFFSNTYDRNSNRQWDDYLSHIGIVIDVDKDGNITFIHHLNTTVGVRIDKLNFKNPDDPLTNSVIRGRTAKDPPHFKYLSGQLCEGFARVFK